MITMDDTAPDVGDMRHESVKVPNIQPRSFGDFRDDHPKMRPVVIDHICRAGETVNLIAASKFGKSWLATDMAMATATGNRWLGSYQTTQGSVLLIDNELHEETLASRLETVREARGYDPGQLESLEVVSLRGELTDIHQLGRWFDTIEPDTYRLIVLDAWYRLIPPGASENDNAHMMHLYNCLDRHAARLGCAFVVIHHASKGDQSGKAVTDVGAGAGAISRCVDTHIIIRPHEQDGYAVMDARLRSFPPMEPQTIYFDHPLWHSSAMEPALACRKSAADRKREEKDRADMDTLQTRLADEAFTAYDVRKVLGVGPQKADRLIRVALEGSLIENVGTTENQRGKEVEQYRVTRLENSFGTRLVNEKANEWQP